MQVAHPIPVFELLHSVLVIAFIVVTAVLFGLTLAQRLRVRDVVMTWRTLSLGSAWPVTFVGVIGVLAVYANNMASTVPAWVFGGYVAGGILWFCAAVLASTIVVSRHGVVSGFGRRENAIPWVQITDYFEVLDRRRIHFVFLYEGAGPERRRIQITVPNAHANQFRALVNERLEGPRQVPAKAVPGRRATS